MTVSSEYTEIFLLKSLSLSSASTASFAADNPFSFDEISSEDEKSKLESVFLKLDSSNPRSPFIIGEKINTARYTDAAALISLAVFSDGVIIFNMPRSKEETAIADIQFFKKSTVILSKLSSKR